MGANELVNFRTGFRLPRWLIDGVAVASLPRWRDAKRFGPLHLWKVSWSKARCAASIFLGKGLHDFFGSDRDFVDSYAYGVVDGVRHRRHDWQKRTLANFLCPEWTSRIRLLHQLCDDFRHIQRSGTFVFQDRREFVHERVREAFREPAKFLLFHQGFAEAHVNAALHLAAYQRGVERATDIVRNPNLGNSDPSGRAIHRDFNDCGGIRIGGGRSDATA